jgi:hypothetical protein
MKGDNLPLQDHICRYCKATTLTEDGQITGTAFQLRQTEESLSVNWLEFLELVNRDLEIQEIRNVLGAKLKLGTSARIAVLSVGNIISYVHAQSPDSRVLKISHEPEEKDPSHSGVYGYQYEDQLIADLIAETIQEVYPARETV